MNMTNQEYKDAKEEIIEELLKELPSNTSIEVELPSENRVYKLEDPGAPITLRPMLFEDEKHLLSAGKGQDPVNILLARCVTNVPITELLPMDKLYLIMKLREISYGDDYNTLLICPECQAENPTTIHLSELNVNPVPDDFEDPITVSLPALKKDIKVRLPRVKDERFINGPDSLDQLWRFVVEVDGHTDKSIIAAVLEKLPIVDMRTILNAMKTDFGLDTKVKLQCSECGGVSVIDLPFDSNFFDVN